MTNIASGFNPPPLAGQTNTLQNAGSIFGFSPETLAQLNELQKSGINFKDLSDYALTQGALDRLKAVSDPEARKKELKEIEEFYLRQGERAQKFGKESLAYTSLMNQINNLPGTIASAFGGAGERQLTQEMYGKIPEIVSETYRTFPRTQIQPVGFSMPSTRYFG